jgi:drug/metabolite transporter (DMT)-like permease
MFMGMTPRAKGIGLLLAAAFLWSLGGVMIKWVDWHPMAIAGMRSAFALPAFLLYTRQRPIFNWSRWQLGGALAYAGTMISLVVATKLTTSANAILLQYTAPIYVALLAPRLLNEPTHARDWLFIVMALGGMSLFFLDQLTPAGMWGNLAGLASGVCFALLIMSLRAQRDSSPFESVILGNILAALICLPFMFGPLPSLQGWLTLLALGTVQLALAYYCYSLGIKTVGALSAIIITTIEPIMNPLWVAWGVGEVPGPWALVGGMLILTAVTGRGIYSARRKGRH